MPSTVSSMPTRSTLIAGSAPAASAQFAVSVKSPGVARAAARVEMVTRLMPSTTLARASIER